MQTSGNDQPEFVPELPDELSPFVKQLQSFVPQSSGSDQNSILFLAGESAARLELRRCIAAGQRQLRYWQAATSACLAAVIGLGFAWHRADMQLIALRNDASLFANNQLSAAATSPVGPANQPISTVNATTLKSGSEDLQTTELTTPLFFDITPENRAVFDEMFQARVVRSVPPSNDSLPATQTERHLREPVLTMRSLLPGSDASYSIQRLMEEPNL